MSRQCAVFHHCEIRSGGRAKDREMRPAPKKTMSRSPQEQAQAKGISQRKWITQGGSLWYAMRQCHMSFDYSNTKLIKRWTIKYSPSIPSPHLPSLTQHCGHVGGTFQGRAKCCDASRFFEVPSTFALLYHQRDCSLEETIVIQCFLSPNIQKTL